MNILLEILIGIFNLVCLGFRMKNTVWSVFGGINPRGSVYSLIGIVQYAGNDAGAIVGVVQYAGNDAGAIVGVVQYAGNDADALVGIVQYAGNDADATITGVQYAPEIKSSVTLLASMKKE